MLAVRAPAEADRVPGHREVRRPGDAADLYRVLPGDVPVTAREIVAGLRQAIHVLGFMGAHHAIRACEAAIDLIEAVNP